MSNTAMDQYDWAARDAQVEMRLDPEFAADAMVESIKCDLVEDDALFETVRDLIADGSDDAELGRLIRTHAMAYARERVYGRMMGYE